MRFYMFRFIATFTFICSLSSSVFAGKQLYLDSTFTISNEVKKIASITKYSYDDKGNKTKIVTEAQGMKIEHFMDYNNKNQCVKDYVGAENKNKNYNTHSYKGDLIEEDKIHVDGKIFQVNEYEHEKKKLKKVTMKHGDGKMMFYSEYAYDGKKTTITSYDSTSSKTSKTIVKHNSDWLPIKATTYDKSDKVISTMTSTYTDKGKLEKTVTVMESMEAITKNKYDKDDNNILTTMTTSMNGSVVSETEVKHFYQDAVNNKWKIDKKSIYGLESISSLRVSKRGIVLTLSKAIASPFSISILDIKGREVCSSTLHNNSRVIPISNKNLPTSGKYIFCFSSNESWFTQMITIHP